MYQDFGPQDPKPQFLEPEPPPRRRLRGPLLVRVVMALSAGGLWGAYNNSQTRAPGDVPVIQADQGTTKTRPQQPGGMAIPDQDKLVYNQGKGQPAVEKLLPPPEAPLPRPAPSAEAPPAPPPLAAPVAPAPSPSAPAPSPSGTIAAAPPAASVPPPAPVAATAPAGYRLQLGAVRSEESARQEWDKLRKANNDLLGSLTAVWPRADLGDRGIFYRIQGCPLPPSPRRACAWRAAACRIGGATRPRRSSARWASRRLMPRARSRVSSPTTSLASALPSTACRCSICRRRTPMG